MAYHVTCPLCGQKISGDNEDALVAAADSHGDENHGARAPREMIISAATHDAAGHDASTHDAATPSNPASPPAATHD